MKAGFTILIAVIITLILSCKLFNFSPLEITDWSPDQVLLEAIEGIQITVEFSAEVDKTGAEKAFSLRENGVEMEGVFVWIDSKSFNFIPDNDLSLYASYEMQVSTDCEDIYGNSLLKQFSQKFSTSNDSGRPWIVSISPADESSSDNPLEPVVVTLSEPVDTSSFYESFSISPSVQGSYSWSSDNSIVTFTPYDLYEFQTEYTITVGKSLSDFSGNTLAEEYISKFTVGTESDKPFIISLGESGGSLFLTPDIPGDGQITLNTGWEANWNFTVTFNEDISIENLLSLIVFSPPVSFTLADPYTEYQDTVEIIIDERLTYNETYELNFNEGIKDRLGNESEKKVYYLKVDGLNTRPPEITHVVFMEDPTIGFEVLIELNYGDTLSLTNYPTPAGEEGFFDLYIKVADRIGIDNDELKLQVMENFDISITNGAAQFITIGVIIDPQAPAELAPLFSPAADEVIARIFMDIINDDQNQGIAELLLQEEFEDSLGNPIEEEWIIRFQKPTN